MNFKIFIFLLDVALLLFILGGFWGAIWLPTRKKDYERIAQLVNLKPGMVFYDLGSGSGDLLFYLSKKYGASCVGIEISPILYLCSKIRSLFYGKVKIKYGDFFKYDLSGADVIYAFLSPKMYERLEEKINSSAKEGAIIVLAGWPFKNVNPSRISKEDKRAVYYLYYKKQPP